MHFYQFFSSIATENASSSRLVLLFVILIACSWIGIVPFVRFSGGVVLELVAATARTMRLLGFGRHSHVLLHEFSPYRRRHLTFQISFFALSFSAASQPGAVFVSFLCLSEGSLVLGIADPTLTDSLN
jgi:hypothetical protein